MEATLTGKGDPGRRSSVMRMVRTLAIRQCTVDPDASPQYLQRDMRWLGALLFDNLLGERWLWK